MILVKSKDNNVVIVSSLLISMEDYNKLVNPDNKKRINAHLRDIHAEHSIKANEQGMVSELVSSITPVATAKKIELVDMYHHRFLEHVAKMPEVSTQQQVNSQQQEKNDENIHIVADLLKELNTYNFNGDDVVEILHRVDFFGIGIGIIPVSLLIEVLDLYVAKYMNRNENNA